MSKGKRNIRKEDRKKTLRKIERELDDETSLKTKIIVAVGFILFLALFYLLAVHITNKNANSTSSNTKDNATTSSDYSEILFGSTFNRSESEYLVLYYDMSDSDLYSTLNSAITDYSTKEESLTIYTVDMSNMYNKTYVTDGETNSAPRNIDELRINGPTLIKISNGVVGGYIEGTDSIKEFLG